MVQTSQDYPFSVVFVQERSSDKGLASFHFKRIFLTVKSQTGGI